MALAVLVDDSNAAYPVRIDPTFNYANWVSLNPRVPGTDNSVYAVVADGFGNLYVGGWFKVVDGTIANGIAKWNGSSWSPLGVGMNDSVDSLALSGNDLYAGGYFTTAGGNPANYIAKWDGSSWSALGLGLDGDVIALAVSGSNLYAGVISRRQLTVVV